MAKLVFILLAFITSCMSSPGLLNFSQPNAFIELDTANFSCSVDTQVPFSFSFEVRLTQNSSLIFTGISGSYDPPKVTRGSYESFLKTTRPHPKGLLGDPLAIFIYTERPYFRLLVMRLTDHQDRFYLHHAFGFFDKPWMGWHKVEVSLLTKSQQYSYAAKQRKGRTEITFRVDQKVNNGFMNEGDILWPDWSLLKRRSLIHVEDNVDYGLFSSNEAFLGTPPLGTMTRHAFEILDEHHIELHAKLGGKDNGTENPQSFQAFAGSLRSFFITSDCACSKKSRFGMKMLQISPGVGTSAVCDARSLPPLSTKFAASCLSRDNGLICGCTPYGSRATCYCPPRDQCRFSREQEKVSKRFGLFGQGLERTTMTEETTLVVDKKSDGSLRLVENPVTHKYTETCFSNFFLCTEPISYQFWVRVDPGNLLNDNSAIISHTSHRQSPWFFKLYYNGLPNYTKLNTTVMQIVAEFQAPPNLRWKIDKCDDLSTVNIISGQWGQIEVIWNTTATPSTLSLLIDGNLCGMAEAVHVSVAASLDARFGSRRTPFIRTGPHEMRDFGFNAKNDLPRFYRFTGLSTKNGSLPSTGISESFASTASFYTSVYFDPQKERGYLRLPGVNFTMIRTNTRLILLDKECSIFQLPEKCVYGGESCFVQVERSANGRYSATYNWHTTMSRLPSTGSRLCSSGEPTHAARQHISVAEGLQPNSEIQLFNLGRSELVRLGLIRDAPFPLLKCQFDEKFTTPCTTSNELRNLTVIADKANTGSNYIALQLNSESTTPESACLRDITLCPFGLTASFAVMVSPSTNDTKRTWKLLNLKGPFGSEIEAHFSVTGRIDVAVKRVLEISNEGAILRTWRASTAIDYLDKALASVVVSWSMNAGLTLQVNEGIIIRNVNGAHENGELQIIDNTELMIAHPNDPRQPASVLINELKIFPAEVNILKANDQEIGTQTLKACDSNTCEHGSFCYPITGERIEAGLLCQCSEPWRICRELLSSRQPSTTTPRKSVHTIDPAISTINATALAPSSTAPKPTTEVRMKTATITSTLVPLTTTMVSTTTTNTPTTISSQIMTDTAASPTSTTGTTITTHAPENLQATTNLENNTTPIFNEKVDEDNDVPLVIQPRISECDRPCQNDGKCILAKGQQVCDCSNTTYWGTSCTRDYVGWLYSGEGSSGPFASYPGVKGRSKLEFVFRSPASLEKANKVTRRIKRKIPTEVDMTLIAFKVQGESTACGLTLNDGALMLLCSALLKSLAYLSPCTINFTPFLGDGIPHKVNLELWGLRVRLKVDGIAYYPESLAKPMCRQHWSFFNIDTNRQDKFPNDSTLTRDGEERMAFSETVLGAWPDGKFVFNGAIGGWSVSDGEMITNLSGESEEGNSQNLYRLNPNFALSQGSFFWVHLNSLTPANVLRKLAPPKKPCQWPSVLWLWVIGWLLGFLLLLSLIAWCSIKLYARRKVHGKYILKRSYTSLKYRAPHPPPALHTKLSLTPLVNGVPETPILCKLKAKRSITSGNFPKTIEPTWRAKMLSLQTLPRSFRADECFASNEAAISRPAPIDDDDIENLIVTPDGNSVITFSSLNGRFVKQWNTQDGTLSKELISNPSILNESVGLAFHNSEGLVFWDDTNCAQLYPTNSAQPKTSVEIPARIWGIYPYEELFLIVAAPVPEISAEHFASLHFWHSRYYNYMPQARLKLNHDSTLKFDVADEFERLEPLLSPGKETLLLRWCSNSPTTSTLTSFSIAVNLKSVLEEIIYSHSLSLNIQSKITASMKKHNIDLHTTAFVTENYVVTGDVNGFLSIWDVHNGSNYYTVPNDPVPMDNHLLLNMRPAEFTQLSFEKSTEPVTALATSRPVDAAGGHFTWLCSGDSNGCTVVRRCITSESSVSKNIACRVHAKFRPFSRSIKSVSSEAVTSITFIIRSGWHEKKPEAYLATGDSGGCIRVWLLPQCTQMAQLSASCESRVLDLVIAQPIRERTLANNQWVQIVGLVGRERRRGYKYGQGRVVIIHLNANEQTGIPNSMYSPRIRIVRNQLSPTPV